MLKQLERGFVYTRLLLVPQDPGVHWLTDTWDYVRSYDLKITWDGIGFLVDTHVNGIRIIIEVPSEDVMAVCVGPRLEQHERTENG